MKIEKFPTLEFEARVLVWDSRQQRAPREHVVIFADTKDAVVAELLDRNPEAITVDSKDARGALVSSSALRTVEASPRAWLARRAAESLGNPSARLRVIGITGTNGKTTCASLLRRLLVASGKRVAEIGTLGLSIWNPKNISAPELALETGFTTPDAPTLQRLLHDLLDLGVSDVVMEVSSHALNLHRVEACFFDCALFTNLTQDHLDHHGTMDNYEAAKTLLFTRELNAALAAGKNPKAILNDIPAGRRMHGAIAQGIEKQLIALGREYEILSHSMNGLELRGLPAGPSFLSPMMGRYNAENLMLVISAARALGTSDGTIRDALRDFLGAKGRLERVPDPKQQRFVFVDYAHTPDAVEKAIATLNDIKGPGARLYCVLGCGGDRDRAKRPKMARAAMNADFVVLTSDNPRTEKPQNILNEMAAGLNPDDMQRCDLRVDRGEAITWTIGRMKAGDVVLVAGKGHEDYQIVGTTKQHSSDFEKCRDALAKYVVAPTWSS